MIVQDLTKLVLLLLIVGVVLAIAVFRPPVPHSLASDPNSDPEPVGDEAVPSQDPHPSQEMKQRERALDQRETELDKRQDRLNECQAELDRREAELNQRKTMLDGREAELDRRGAEFEGREAGLDQVRVELDQREAKLEEWAAVLQAWDERLIKQDGLLDEEWVGLREAEARLRHKEMSLAEQEQKLQGFLRWSVVAVVVSGLLAVPSVLVLVALMRQGRRERVTQHGRPAKVTSAPTFSDNGRDRERVRHRR